MDPKGIDYSGIMPNLAITAIKAERKNEPPVKPVSNIKKGDINLDLEKEEEGDALTTTLQTLSNRRSNALLERSLKQEIDYDNDIDINWEFNRETGMLVVIVREKETGKIIREIPPKELSKMLADNSYNGILIDKKA